MAEIKIQSFLILEQSLTKRLVATWRKFSLGLFIRIQKAIAKEDWTRVEILIDDINFSRVLSSNKRFMEFIGRGAFLFGVARHGEIKDSSFVKDKEPIPLLTDASENLQSVIAEQGDLFVKQNIRRAVATIKTRIEESKITKEETVTKAAKVRTNAQLLSNAIDGRTDQYLENVSSLHNSRLAGWGYVQEAEALGITTYTVSEQVGSDTICPICISMHGKTFQVSEARGTLDQRLTVDNLNDLNQIARFPRQSKRDVQIFRNLSNPELVENGWHVPPYHPRCRGLLVKSTDTANLGPLPQKAKRRIPKPVKLPVRTTTVRNIAGLDKIDSDEVRRLFPSLVGNPSAARRALVKKRTTDQMLDALRLRDAEVLLNKTRFRSPAQVATQTSKFKGTVGDKNVIKMVEQLADDYVESGMNPAVLRNRPIARLHVGSVGKPRGVGRNLGTYWGGLPDSDKLVHVSRRDNIKTLRHEMSHHFDFSYTRLDNPGKFRPDRPLIQAGLSDLPTGLNDAVNGMRAEFQTSRKAAIDQIGARFQVQNFEHWRILETEGMEQTGRISAYSIYNDREWMAEHGALYYSGKSGRNLLKRKQPATFKLLDEINKGKYLNTEDVAVASAESRLERQQFGF